MGLLHWLRGTEDRRKVTEEREETRKSRGQLAAKLVELDNARFHLDEMVKRSLILMEGKKK